MKITFKYILFLSIVLIGFASCEENRCKVRAVVCNNGGVCYDGICNCPAGFVGDSCQETANEMYVAKYGGVLIGSTITGPLGTNDTLTVYKLAGDNNGIFMLGKKFPEKDTLVAKVKNNAITISNYSARNGYKYNGTGSLNGKLLTLSMSADAFDINGILIDHVEYTFSGNKH